MSRSINVTTEVFAAIWAQRQSGEESEDAILRRLLRVREPQEANMGVPQSAGGILDPRNNVHFPEGFEIFRTYKRREYRAEACGGTWLRSDSGQRYPSLNQLNSSIAAGVENVWNGNWKYRGSDGRIRSIAELRR